jgi:hypothetical protein
MKKSKKETHNSHDAVRKALYAKRDKALEDLVEAYMKAETTGMDPDDGINTALDVLAMAQIAVTLYFVSGAHI